MKILAVHGYEVYGPSQLGALAETVCRKVAKLHTKYQYIILLGGWHRPEAGPLHTIAQVMYRRLLALGVPEQKLYTQDLLGCNSYLPPRDSMEEVDLLPTLLRALNFNPLITSFDALCVWYFIPRLKFLYATRGAQCRVIGAFSLRTLLPKQILMQILAYLIMRKDPQGISPLVQKNREKRTLISDPVPFFKNTHNAWK